MGSQEDESIPLNILCLDGGGVRGLSSLIVLDRIMEAVQIKLELSARPFPYEVFDMICGTSTGGLIALMLGRLRMSVKDAIKCYRELSEHVFGSKVPLPYLKRIRGKAIYDASNLETCIKKICADHGGEEALLRDPQDDHCRVFVVAVTQVHAAASPKLFRSYKTGLTMPDQCSIWQAARATTAASTFFDPMKVGDPPITYIDGGLSRDNNPSKLAREEIRRIYPRRPIGCFLSIGTGVGKVVSVSRSYAGIAKACAKLITDCQIVDHDVDKEFHNEMREGGQASPYFRFSVEVGVGTIQLDEWKQLDKLIGVTSGYLLSNTQSSKIERCRNRLVDTMKRRAQQSSVGGGENTMSRSSSPKE